MARRGRRDCTGSACITCEALGKTSVVERSDVAPPLVGGAEQTADRQGADNQSRERQRPDVPRAAAFMRRLACARIPSRTPCDGSPFPSPCARRTRKTGAAEEPGRLGARKDSRTRRRAGVSLRARRGGAETALERREIAQVHVVVEIKVQQMPARNRRVDRGPVHPLHKRGEIGKVYQPIAIEVASHRGTADGKTVTPRPRRRPRNPCWARGRSFDRRSCIPTPRWSRRP